MLPIIRYSENVRNLFTSIFKLFSHILLLFRGFFTILPNFFIFMNKKQKETDFIYKKYHIMDEVVNFLY